MFHFIMDICQPSKKIRLSVNNNVNNANNDDIGWGEDIDVDDDFIQEIETQGYSQYPNTRSTTSAVPYNAYSSQTSGVSHLTQVSGNHLADIESELQTKTGEIKNLRNLIEKYQSQIVERDNVIVDLEKRLTGKDTEIELQKIASKAKLSNLNSTIVKRLPSRSPNLQRKFLFSDAKHDSKEPEIFNFARKLDQGDVLYKLLRSVLINNDEAISTVLETNMTNAGAEDGRQSNLILDENEFMVKLKSLLLQLCWYSSFEEVRAHQLIIFILSRCQELLTGVYRFLSREPAPDATNLRSKIITLDRSKDTTNPSESYDLLKHTRLFPSEKGIAARQTITAIAKMIEVHSSLARMIIETEPFVAAKWNGIKDDQIRDTKSGLAAVPTISRKDNSDFADSSLSSGENTRWKHFFQFDVIALVHDIVHEITIRNKSNEYEGVLSSILYLYSVLCSHDTIIIYQKHEELIIKTIKKILFSLPSFVLIRDIVAFLSSCSQYSFSGSLCCRSAAETFSENFRCYNFTRDTCVLQVLCVYVEMMKKTPHFVCNYISWILSSISELHEIRWVRNKKDSKLCECLQLLEQITIKVILSCIEQYNDTKLSSSSKVILQSALRRSVSIFQLFRYKDSNFDQNILPCRGEYRMMLHSLKEIIVDRRTKNFVDQEYLRTDEEQMYELSTEKREKLAKSLLQSCNYDYD